MEVHQLDGHDHGLGHGVVELDICFGCQGIWFDHRENLKLSPQAVVELFTLLHQHRTDERRPLQRQLACPRCVRPLAQSFDVVRGGRYMVYRCAQQHGRFSAFSSFMVEKGFVRHLTRAEVDDLARRVDAIYCTGCGAPVDIRKDHACPHCRSAFSLLDPQAVARALEGYAGAAQRQATPRPLDLADALIDAGYEIRVDAAVEDMRDSPSEIRVPLTNAGAGKPQAGKQYIQTLTYQLQ